MGLGKDFDIGIAYVPVDLGTAGATGARVHLENYGKLTFVGLLAVGTAAENPTFTLQEHNAATAGTSADLAVVAQYFTKVEATLDGDEAWTKVTQTAAADVTDVTWDDANQVLVVFEVNAEELSDGYEWVSVNVDDPGTAQIGAGIYVMSDLKVQRAPANLAQPNA
jgi:hypothetical protein